MNELTTAMRDLADAMAERNRLEAKALAGQLKSTADWWLLSNARDRVSALWERYDALTVPASAPPLALAAD